MKLLKATIRNFRLLENVEINLDDTATVIVGKNNTGKTSFSRIFDIFLNNKPFSFDDFSLKSHSHFISTYEEFIKINNENRIELLENIRQIIPKIILRLEIRFFEDKDTLSNIRPFGPDLDSDKIYVEFEYSPKNTENLLTHIKEEIANEKNNSMSLNQQIIEKFRENIIQAYRVIIKSKAKIDNDKFQTKGEVTRTDVNNLLQRNFINAQRGVDDTSSDEKQSKLSSLLASHYDRRYKLDSKEDSIKTFRDKVNETNQTFDKKFHDFFKEFIEAYEEFGFQNTGKQEIALKSSINPTNMFKNSVKLMYPQGDTFLPEKYNGLGYSNLVYIISKILEFQEEFQGNDATHCLIFIEEPEAHMHPQMQSIFIQKIAGFLKKRGFSAQIIITTHSSHILSNAELDSIRYFTRNQDETITKVKDLMNFNPNKTPEETKQFLKQYMTLINCDLFFADKAVLFEGVVERLLMNVFIQKTDNEYNTKLLSDYIAFIEVGGRYMDKFKELLEFLELKTLIITDLDAEIKIIKKDKNGKLIKTSEKAEITKNYGLITSNSTLTNWLPKESNIMKLLNLKESQKILKNIRVAYQTNKYPPNKIYPKHQINKYSQNRGKPQIKSSYGKKKTRSYSNKSSISHRFSINRHANKPRITTLKKRIPLYNQLNKIKCGRSFEEAFIIENPKFLIENYLKLSSVKYILKKYTDEFEILKDSYEVADFIGRNDKKTDFAFDLLTTQNKWQTPTYIKEGLLWLAK